MLISDTEISKIRRIPKNNLPRNECRTNMEKESDRRKGWKTNQLSYLIFKNSNFEIIRMLREITFLFTHCLMHLAASAVNKFNKLPRSALSNPKWVWVCAIFEIALWFRTKNFVVFEILWKTENISVKTISYKEAAEKCETF